MSVVFRPRATAKNSAVDKYLSDFETDKISKRVLERRVGQLNEEIDQLHQRRDALRLALDIESATPNEHQLAQVADRLIDIIRAADLPERQALCEALIDALHLGSHESATPVLRARAA